MDTDSLQLALAEKDLYDCVWPEKMEQWEALQRAECTDLFSADARRNFFLCTLRAKHKKLDKREAGLFKEVFRNTARLYFCSKTYYCHDVGSNKFKLISRGLKKWILEQSADGPLKTYRRVLEEKINITQRKEVSEHKIILLLPLSKLRKGYFFTLNG